METQLPPPLALYQIATGHYLSQALPCGRQARDCRPPDRRPAEFEPAGRRMLKGLDEPVTLLTVERQVAKSGRPQMNTDDHRGTRSTLP